MKLETKFGLALIAIFLVKVILSVVLQTGFSPMLIGLNSVYLIGGIILIGLGLRK